MARSEKFQKQYFVEMESIIRGHHVYKTVWTPVTGESLFCRHDERDEAKQFDNYAVGIYTRKEREEVLVGHVPIEFSYLFYKFMEKDGSKIDVKVCGGRQLENGWVVPATYFVCGTKKLVGIFLDEAKKRQKKKAAHMNIKLSEISKNFGQIL